MAEMLRDALAGADPTPLPGLEHRLVAGRGAGGDEFRLHELKPELRQLLLASL